MKKIIFVALIFCLLFTFSYNCDKTPKPPTFKIDHFKVYKVDTSGVVPLPIHVQLKDQFDRFPKSAAISYIEYFANPVSKNDEAIIDSTAHLTWYPFLDDTLAIHKSVKISNQFGTFRWKLGKPVYLLVPTHKIEADIQFPDTLMIDHFKCYEVTAVEVLQRKITLVDQFDKKLDRVEKVIVDRPLFFGVPVIKNEQPIINKEDHLACYHITPLPGPAPPEPMKVSFKNQFGKGTLTARESYMLCVPSKKSVIREGEE